MNVKVLVTGTGGVIGYGILRALQMAKQEVETWAADASAEAVGFRLCSKRLVIARADAPDYAERLLDFGAKYGPVLILPGIEQDLERLMAEQHRLASCGIKVALPDAKTYSVTNDKWLTHQFLTQKGIPATPTLLLSEPVDALLAQMDFPLIIKQRRGSGGKGLRLVNDLESLHLLRRQLHGREYLVQPLVGREDEEFTCGSYRTLTGRLLGPILLRRKLGYGSTIKATSEYRPELALWVNQLLSHLSGQGPFCCQVRMVDEEPRLLEVNYRLSSSTSIKASLGFNEPAMLVQELILGQEPSEPKITWGQTIARYLEDMVL